MADSNKPPSPPLQPPRPSVLNKIRSLPADNHRNKEWEKLKIKQRLRLLSRSKSVDSFASAFDVTDEDIKELKACFDLGFGFDLSSELDPKLTEAFPALGLYAAVNRQLYNRDLSRSSSVDSLDSNASNASSRSFIVDTNDDPEKVKMRLKRWAQVVGCSVHEVCTQRKTEVAEAKSTSTLTE